VVGRARADDEITPTRYFYKGYDYGSQSLYSPLYLLLNRGYDELQLRPGKRNILGQNYLLNARNVIDNVTSPFKAISGEGWQRFMRQEILPLSFTATTARWVPNYTLHLLGGGSSYTALREWYEDHDAPSAIAKIFSVATLFTAALINETLENNDIVGRNTDCLADLYVFDVAGVLLFSIDEVNHFFTHTMILSDWSLQPAVMLPSGQLQNAGNYYSLKFPLPFYRDLRLFAYGGYSSLAGLSWKFDRQHSVTVAAGGRVDYFDNSSTVEVANIVQMRPSGAIFLDRNESLLASVQVSDAKDYFLQMNVYPNAIVHTDPGFGFFTVLTKDARFAVGVSVTRLLGLGVGAGTFK
jgi:hypothetical protein